MELTAKPWHFKGPFKRAAIALLPLLGALSLLGGCSGETAKRTAFETLQNLHEQQCEQDMSGKCSRRETYDDYQRKRDEARSADIQTPPSTRHPDWAKAIGK